MTSLESFRKPISDTIPSEFASAAVASTHAVPFRAAGLGLLGDKGVGKQSLRFQFIDRSFPPGIGYGPEEDPEDPGRRLITMGEQPYLIETLQLSFDPLELPFRDAQLYACAGIILVYSIAFRQSFTNIHSFFDCVRHARGDSHCPIILIGNKSDLTSERVVQTVEGERLAAKLHLGHFFETSTKTGQNVEEAFFDIVAQIWMRDQLFKSPAVTQNAAEGEEVRSQGLKGQGIFGCIKHALCLNE